MRMGFFSKLKIPQSLYTERANDGNPKVSRAISKFIVDIKEPHRVWKPAELMTGEVLLSLAKPVKNVRLRLTLLGKLKVRTGNGTTSRLKLRKELFKRSNIIYGDPTNDSNGGKGITNGLTKGDHRFPFRMKVPSKNIYMSIEFERGSISYSILCTLESTADSAVLSTCSRRFSILVPIGVVDLPKPGTKTVVLQSPGSLRHRKDISDEQEVSSTRTPETNNSGNSASSAVTKLPVQTVTISVDVEESGYIIGDEIKFRVNVQHYKDYSHSAGVIATLVRICRVHGSGKDDPMETFRKDICQCVAPMYIDPATHECSINLNLKVPLDAFPTLIVPNCGFSFQYYIEVLVNLSPKNIVYTESNRVIGGVNPTDIPVPNFLGNATKKIDSISSRFLPSRVTGENDNCDGSLIFFQDMVNVDKLKRLKNVTGTSIEIVIGTHRDAKKVIQMKPSGSTEELRAEASPHISDMESIVSPSRQLILATYDNMTSNVGRMPTPQDSGALYSDIDNTFYPADPVPRYTSSYEYEITEDKKELEGIRLRELESEPS